MKKEKPTNTKRTAPLDFGREFARHNSPGRQTGFERMARNDLVARTLQNLDCFV
jgi:hypothetical protein